MLAPIPREPREHIHSMSLRFLPRFNVSLRTQQPVSSRNRFTSRRQRIIEIFGCIGNIVVDDTSLYPIPHLDTELVDGSAVSRNP
jgi:hypothetical protein